MNKILKKQALFMLVVFLLSVMLNSVAIAVSGNSIFGSTGNLLDVKHEIKGKEVAYSIALDKVAITSKKGSDDQQLFLTNEFGEDETFAGVIFLNDRALTKGSHKQIASFTLAILEEGVNDITFKTTVA